MCLILTLRLRPCRLLEYAPLYYDMASFPDSEAKRALVRVDNKRRGKADLAEQPKKKKKKAGVDGGEGQPKKKKKTG